MEEASQATAAAAAEEEEAEEEYEEEEQQIEYGHVSTGWSIPSTDEGTWRFGHFDT
jgi:hypothetical protein